MVEYRSQRRGSAGILNMLTFGLLGEPASNPNSSSVYGQQRKSVGTSSSSTQMALQQRKSVADRRRLAPGSQGSQDVHSLSNSFAEQSSNNVSQYSTGKSGSRYKRGNLGLNPQERESTKEREREKEDVRLPSIMRSNTMTGTGSARIVPTPSSSVSTASSGIGLLTRQRSEKTPSSSSKPAAGAGGLCCDKCDGKHETEKCPNFKKSRDKHPDAQKNFYKKMGGASSSLPGKKISAGKCKVVRQPGDGSCLFHSMSYGINGHNASSLRAAICNFIATRPDFLICATPVKDWVKWDSSLSPGEYARRMSRGQWGGGIEMAVCCELAKVNVHVYERDGYLGGYKRISAFDCPTNPEGHPIVRVVYQGGVHYDSMVL